MLDTIPITNHCSSFIRTDTIVVNINGGIAQSGSPAFKYRPQLGTGSSLPLNTIVLSSAGSYTSSTAPTLTFTTNPIYQSTASTANYSAGSGGNMTANMTPVPSTTTSTKITYNLNDFQIYKGKNDSIAKPSYTWVNDNNTGIYHPANEIIGFVWRRNM